MKEMTTPIKIDEPKKIITEFSEYKKKKEPVNDYEERKETVISSRDVEYFDWIIYSLVKIIILKSEFLV